MRRGDVAGSDDKLCWKECGTRDDDKPYLCWEKAFLDQEDEDEGPAQQDGGGMLQLVVDTEYRERLRRPARVGEPVREAAAKPSSYLEVAADGRFGQVARSRKLEMSLYSAHSAIMQEQVLGEDDDEDDDDDEDERDEPPEKPTLYKKFNCATWGSRQMRSVVLLTMVLMEFLMLFGFAKYEFAFFDLMGNKVFMYVWVPMLAVLFWYVYSPVHVFDHDFAPLDFLGFIVSVAMTLLFYASFEITKVLHRYWFEQELEGKKAVARLASEGRLKAFASRKEAWKQYPDRRPLLA